MGKGGNVILYRIQEINPSYGEAIGTKNSGVNLTEGKREPNQENVELWHVLYSVPADASLSTIWQLNRCFQSVRLLYSRIQIQVRFRCATVRTDSLKTSSGPTLILTIPPSTQSGIVRRQRSNAILPLPPF